MARNESYYRKLFLVGALYNWAAGAAFLSFHRQMFGVLGMPPVSFSSIPRSRVNSIRAVVSIAELSQKEQLCGSNL